MPWQFLHTVSYSFISHLVVTNEQHSWVVKFQFWGYEIKGQIFWEGHKNLNHFITLIWCYRVFPKEGKIDSNFVTISQYLVFIFRSELYNFCNLFLIFILFNQNRYDYRIVILFPKLPCPIEYWRLRILKNGITGKSESSKQFLIQNAFLNYCRIWWIRTIRIQIGKK